MVQVPFLVLGHNTFPDQLTFRKYCTLEPPLKDQALSLSLSLSPTGNSTAGKNKYLSYAAPAS
jgi:hypothetical protein